MTFKIKEGINVGAVPIIDNQSKYQQALPIPVIRPTLNLDFINQRTIDPRLSFTRASNATYIDSKGFVATANTNVPRFQYDVATGQTDGLFIEDQRTNLVQYSNGFDQSVWTPGNARVERDLATMAPDGSLSAYKITATGTSFPRISRGSTGITAQVYSWSIYVKPGNVNYVHATFEISGSEVVRFYGNINTLATSAITYIGTVSCVPSLTAVGNGWYRFAGLITVAVAGTYSMYFGPASGIGTTANVGDYVWIWGAQLEASTYSTTSSYIPTTDTFTSRASLASYVDSTDDTIKYAGVNLITYSNSFADASWVNGAMTTWSPNSDYAPDGTNTAWRLTMPIGAGTYAAHAVSLTSGQTYVFSVYVKSSSLTPTLSIIFEASAGSGAPLVTTNITATNTWTRYNVTYTAASTATYYVTFDNQGNTAAADVLIWGAQCEVGTTPTLAAITTSSTTAAARPLYNPTTRTNTGLFLEPNAATNLFPSSVVTSTGWAIDITTTVNASTAPDGTSTAALFTAPAGVTMNNLYYNVGCTVTAGSVYTWSVYVKLGTMVAADYKFAMYDLTNSAFIGVELSPSVTLLMNSWKRITYTFTAPAGCTSVRPYLYRAANTGAGGTVYLWGAQLEAGYMPTSYIPTVAATATRSADVSSSAQTTRQYDTLSTSNFDWMNFDQGTFVVDFDVINYAATPLVIYSPSTEYATSRYYGQVGTWNGTTELNVVNSNANTMVYACYSVAYNSAGRAASLNGSVANTGSGAFSTTVPAAIYFGSGIAGNRPIGGHLKRLAFYPYAASNTELRALSRV